ncbi:MAG: alpha/beta hydrolase [Colwellia sp.]|nr:alpha/beta hydrolase [Colwellia sp.]
MFNIVFVPGYGNSINGHWQEIWYKEFKDSYWVEQDDWENPDCVDWVETLNLLIQSLEGPILLVTHSLGGSTVVEWSKKYTANVLGAFLVAVPDVQSVNFPEEISGYQTPPLEKLPFPSLVLASTDDPYSKLDRTKYFAKTWGSELISIGNLGHVNTDSNIGKWSEGKNQLNKFIGSLDTSGSNRYEPISRQ